MHDWTLLSLHLDWRASRLRLELRDRGSRLRVIQAEGVADLVVPHRDDWGPSASVLQVLGPEPGADGCLRLRIEMQSGDTIGIEARAFELPE